MFTVAVKIPIATTGIGDENTKKRLKRQSRLVILIFNNSRSLLKDEQDFPHFWFPVYDLVNYWKPIDYYYCF